MKVNSVSMNTPCQNRPQNFGALLLTPQGAKAMLTYAEKGLPGSLGDLIGKAVIKGDISDETGIELLSWQKKDVLVLHDQNERDLLSSQLASGDEGGAATTILNLLSSASKFDVGKMVGLKPGENLRDVVRARFFKKPVIKDVPIQPIESPPIHIEFEGTDHRVKGGVRLILDPAHLEIDERVESIRNELFTAAQRGVVESDFKSAVETRLTHGIPIKDIGEGRCLTTTITTEPDGFDIAPQTIKDSNPLGLEA